MKKCLSPAKAGVIQEITRWDGLRLTLADDLAAAGVKTGDHFSIRRAATLDSVFDPRTCPLRGGLDPAQADLVAIPRGASLGQFQQCFLLRTPEGLAGKRELQIRGEQAFPLAHARRSRWLGRRRHR